MRRMGKYCKAYYLGKLREFSGWTERLENARTRKEQTEDREVEVQRGLTDDSILYLQEDFTVTDGIFLQENVIFGNPTPEWISFCKENLAFEATPDEPIANGSSPV